MDQQAQKQDWPAVMDEQKTPGPRASKGVGPREGRRTARRRRELRNAQDSQQLQQEASWSSGERFMVEKVHEFFQQCGGAERGFITRDDMEKLQDKFDFSPEELEMVFNKLDVDQTGHLTPEKLTKGLSHFLTDQRLAEDGSQPQSLSESLYQSQGLQQQVEVEDEEKQQFAALMERLGASTVFPDEAEIWKLWVQLRRNEPNLLGHLEDFLSKVTVRFQDAQSEKDDLERTLKKKMVEHNTEVQKLYEEMELQINNEKDRIETENTVKLHAQSQDLQKELDSKQEEVQHLAQAQAQLEAELVFLRSKQNESITENEMLKVTNQELETRLEQVQQDLQEARDRLVDQQEEAAHREEREGERDQPPGNDGLHFTEVYPQKETRQRWGSDTSQGFTSSECLQRNLESSGHVTRIISIEEEPLPQQVQVFGIQRSRVTRQEVDMSTVKDGDVVFEDRTEPLWSVGEARLPKELQEELVSLRSRQGEAVAEIQMLKVTNQELETRLKQIQQDLQEARDRLVDQQEGAAHREEREREQKEAIAEMEKLKVTNQELETRLEQVQQGLQEAQGQLVDQQEEAAQREEREGEQKEAIAEMEKLKVTNQELETRLQQIQQSLQEAQDQLVDQQEEAAHRKEREREQKEAIAEMEKLKVTNQELETRLEQVQQDLQEAQDRLVDQQEEAAHRKEREREQKETIAEMEKLKVTNQELETKLEQIQQDLQEAQDRLVDQQEEAAHREEREREQKEAIAEMEKLKVTNQELETKLEQIQQDLQEARDQLVDQEEAAQREEREREQKEAIAEMEKLKVTNQELETKLEQIQQDLQEARDQLVAQQEDAAHREEREGEQKEAIAEMEKLKVTNQELETRLEQIQQDLQEARDRLVDQEEAAHREEREREQKEAIAEMEKLKVTNQELETRLEQVQQDLQEARDRLVDQEEAAHREERESEQKEAIAEMEKLKVINQELETRLEQVQQDLQEARDRLVDQQEVAVPREEREGLQRTRSIRRRATQKPTPLGEDPALAHLRVEGQGVTMAMGNDGDGVTEEPAASLGSDGAGERMKELQEELVSLRSKQDEVIAENQKLKVTKQELEAKVEQIQQDLQEARDRLMDQQGDAAHREEREGELKEAIAEMEKLKVTNQELETRLEQVQQDLQEARDRLVDQQEEAAHREEREGEQKEAIAEMEKLKVTNQELETRLEQVQQDLQEARDRLVDQQEGAAHREEREREQKEAIAEMEKLKVTNQELETRLEQVQQDLQEARDRLADQQEVAAPREEREGLQRTRSIRRHANQKPTPLGEDPALAHLRVEGQGVTMATGDNGDGVTEEPAAPLGSDGAGERMKELQEELVSLRSKQDEAIAENQKLKVTNQELEAKVEQIQQDLQEARDRLVGQQGEAAHREEREGEQKEAIAEMEKLKVTNQELETRLQQIQQDLQEARDQLVDQQEEAAQREEREGLQRTRSIRRRATQKPTPLGEDPALAHLRVEGQGVTVATGNDGDGVTEEPAASLGSDGAGERMKELQEELVSLRSKQDEAIAENQKLKATNQELEAKLEQIRQDLQEARDRLEEAARREETEGLHRTHSIRRRATQKPTPLGGDPALAHLTVEGQDVIVVTGDDVDGVTEEPAATSGSDGAEERIKEVGSSKDPDHLYNIMFVGNANTGKTSFIQRFYDNSFKPGLASTVGMDYRVKTLTVDNRHIALQLWDTAGQERFRSLTKQFFRKADGVIVMYDITSSSSFAEVRYWLGSIKETVDDNVAILLLGNKTDDVAHRKVPTPEGQRLAQEYNIMFYECSACTGHNISTAMLQLTKLLKQQDEKIKGSVVEMVNQPRKKGKCCT
ncbi:restin homolog isoform X2 [Stegostoma tigrinum]|uniref:restin homolog isoform X2 n=1 Tax=Stegostoma tigrinum TaxID=3053191 RepID=UPI0028706FD0|nr:restin homolog isoform X2 [Stegostoma tigrinum]